MKMARQLTFSDLRRKTGRGGPRIGAGRPAAARPVVHHVKRDEVLEREPAHVTIRVVGGAGGGSFGRFSAASGVCEGVRTFASWSTRFRSITCI